MAYVAGRARAPWTQAPTRLSSGDWDGPKIECGCNGSCGSYSLEGSHSDIFETTRFIQILYTIWNSREKQSVSHHWLKFPEKHPKKLPADVLSCNKQPAFGFWFIFFSHRKAEQLQKTGKTVWWINCSVDAVKPPIPPPTFPLVLGAVPCQDGSHDGFERQEEEILH